MLSFKFIKKKYYSYLLVFLQFILIILIGLNSSINQFSFVSLVISFSGLFLGFWAVWVARKTKLTILPDVRSGSTLITSGPYKFIRHPMYSSVLLFCLGLLFTNYNFIGALYFFLLFLVLSFKVRYEEIKLNSYFPKYKEYAQKTKRLIPFVI